MELYKNVGGYCVFLERTLYNREMARVLVLGGAGYIGSVFISYLLDSGFEVTVIDNFEYDKNSLSAFGGNSNLKIVVADQTDSELMAGFYSMGFDWIFPLAGIVGAPACSKMKTRAHAINLDAQIYLFDHTPKHSRIIMPTTNSAYGTTHGDYEVDETYPLAPISEYAKQKVEVERALLSRKNVCSFRLATVFGMSPRMRLDLLVNDFVRRAMRDRSISIFEGNFMRNYVHVRDVSRAFIFAMEHWDIFRDEVFNLGHPNANISKLDLARMVAAETDGDVQVFEADFAKDLDQRNYRISNRKIIQTGFEFNFDLLSGIKELINGIPPYIFERYGNA